MSSVILTGFMGTGKSTVGRLLAARLQRPFIDTDARVEALAGRSVAALFADAGEAHFRALERQVLTDALQSDAVVATGGGAILDADNYRRMRAAGPIICLAASVEVILARTGTHPGSRPLLGSGDPAARVRSLLAARATAYAQADLTIDTSDRSAEVVVADICAFLEHHRGHPAGGQS